MNQRNRFDQTAATPIVEERETPKMLHTIGDFVFTPAGRSASFMALLGIGCGFALLALVYSAAWLFLLAFGFAFAGVGGMVMLLTQLRNYQPHVSRTHYEYAPPEPERKPESNDITFDLQNNLLPATIWQPYPGAFRQWLAEVLANDRVQFSLNQARARKWPDERYHNLVTQLREAGLLHRSETKNSAPVCTEEGKKKAREWLKR